MQIHQFFTQLSLTTHVGHCSLLFFAHLDLTLFTKLLLACASITFTRPISLNSLQIHRIQIQMSAKTLLSILEMSSLSQSYQFRSFLVAKGIWMGGGSGWINEKSCCWTAAASWVSQLAASQLGMRLASVRMPDLCGDQLQSSQRVESFWKAKERGECLAPTRELVAILVSA